MPNTQLSIQIPKELKRNLKNISDISYRSESYLVTKAVAEYIARNEWKIKALKKAKAEADKGFFISQEAMEAWVNSIGTDNELAPPSIDVFPNQ